MLRFKVISLPGENTGVPGGMLMGSLRARISLILFPAAFIPLHVGHGSTGLDQRFPRPLMKLVSRYEHIIMREVNYLATREWIHRIRFTRRLVDGIGNGMMKIVNGEILTRGEVNEMLESIFAGGYTVAVGTCPCRRARNQLSDELPNNCDMVFGRWAVEYLENYPGLYRRLDIDEALRLVERFDECGFIHQLYGARSIEGAAFVLCNCAPDVCIPLEAQRTRGYPAFRKGRSAAAVDAGKCLGPEACGACLERCQFGARSAAAGVIECNREKCFGCGLCLATCRGKATRLERVKGRELIYARHLVGEG